MQLSQKVELTLRDRSILLSNSVLASLTPLGSFVSKFGHVFAASLKIMETSKELRITWSQK